MRLTLLIVDEIAMLDDAVQVLVGRGCLAHLGVSDPFLNVLTPSSHLCS